MALIRMNKLKRRFRRMMPRPVAATAFHDCRLVQERVFDDPALARLEAARSNVTSQNGEDGVIAEIFRVIGSEHKVAVEFGAWDGRHLSNTWTLLEHEGWRGVLIEADAAKHAGLAQSYSEPERHMFIHAMVGFEGGQRLDMLLAAAVPRDFDLLSIDVDSTDWHIFNAMDDYKPRLIVIEFNPAIPNNVSFVQAASMEVAQGSSLHAIRDLARRKGYELAFALDTNAFLVRADLYPKLGIVSNRLDIVHPSNPHLVATFELFDGTIVVAGRDQLIWGEGSIAASMRHAVVRAGT